jgi:hypothetical protein
VWWDKVTGVVNRWSGPGSNADLPAEPGDLAISVNNLGQSFIVPGIKNQNTQPKKKIKKLARPTLSFFFL